MAAGRVRGWGWVVLCWVVLGLGVCWAWCWGGLAPFLVGLAAGGWARGWGGGFGVAAVGVLCCGLWAAAGGGVGVGRVGGLVVWCCGGCSVFRGRVGCRGVAGCVWGSVWFLWWWCFFSLGWLGGFGWGSWVLGWVLVGCWWLAGAGGGWWRGRVVFGWGARWRVGSFLLVRRVVGVSGCFGGGRWWLASPVGLGWVVGGFCVAVRSVRRRGGLLPGAPVVVALCRVVVCFWLWCLVGWLVVLFLVGSVGVGLGCGLCCPPASAGGGACLAVLAALGLVRGGFALVCVGCPGLVLPGSWPGGCFLSGAGGWGGLVGCPAGLLGCRVGVGGWCVSGGVVGGLLFWVFACCCRLFRLSSGLCCGGPGGFGGGFGLGRRWSSVPGLCLWSGCVLAGGFFAWAVGAGSVCVGFGGAVVGLSRGAGGGGWWSVGLRGVGSGCGVGGGGGCGGVVAGGWAGVCRGCRWGRGLAGLRRAGVHL